MGGCPSVFARRGRPGHARRLNMPNLSIRNITTTPLALIEVERFNTGACGGYASRFTSTITSLFRRDGATHASDRQQPACTKSIRYVVAKPFETAKTDVPLPRPGRETLRLTFSQPDTSHHWTVCIPPETCRSIELRPVDTASAPPGITAVWQLAYGLVALFSSSQLAQWMAELRDDLPLSALSIPGTHNSTTHHVALPSVRCQSVSVREQLENGVRFLDVRVSCSGPDNPDLDLVHSLFSVSLSGRKWFADLLAVVYGFLDDNPSEAVVMSLKREGTGKGTDHDMSRHLATRYATTERWFTSPRIPTLGEARGRVVLMRRFDLHESLRKEHDGQGWGIDGSLWPDNCADAICGSGLIRIQDYYEIGSTNDVRKKLEFARATLARAAQQVVMDAERSSPSDRTPLPFFVNFLSGSNFYNTTCWPEKIAAKLNPAMTEYLCTAHADVTQGQEITPGDAGTGIVVIDWVGHHDDWDLVRCIVGWNARLYFRR